MDAGRASKNNFSPAWQSIGNCFLFKITKQGFSLIYFERQKWMLAGLRKTISVLLGNQLVTVVSTCDSCE